MKQFLTMLLIAATGFVWLWIAGAVADWRRWRQLTGFAASYGYTLDKEDTSNAAPFFENLSSWHLLAWFEINQVSNILRGKVEDIDFVYFEQLMTAGRGSIAFSGRHGHKLDPYSQSVVALEVPESAHFEFNPESHKDMKVRRIGNWVYFLPSEPYVIPVRELEKFLAEISGIFKAGLGKAGGITVS